MSLEIGQTVILHGQLPYKLRKYKGRLGVVTQIVSMGRSTRVRVKLCSRAGSSLFALDEFLVARCHVRPVAQGRTLTETEAGAGVVYGILEGGRQTPPPLWKNTGRLKLL